MEGDLELEALRDRLLSVYKDPIYRFESITVDVHKLSGATQTTVLGVDIGNVVTVTWTPNSTGSAITRMCVVEGVRHSVSAEMTHVMTLTLNDSSIAQTGHFWTVEDATYGVVDGGGALAYPVAF